MEIIFFSLVKIENFWKTMILYFLITRVQKKFERIENNSLKLVDNLLFDSLLFY